MISINGKKVNKDIKNLNLAYNNITILPIEIGQLKQSSTLHLTNNNITKLPVEIGGLTQLTTLYLNSNNLTHLPVEIGQLTQLTTLTLYDNNITQLPVEIGKLTQLTRLNFSNNKLTQIPVEIGKLTQLTTLYLQNNKLTHLPVEIGQLTQLTKLYLSNNNITQLPVEIGHLIQLTTLYLQINKLTNLPVEIGQLTRLTTLTLYNNPIENLLNPIIQRVIQRIENRPNGNNGNTIYTDTQNVHSSSIQKSIKDSIYRSMNSYLQIKIQKRLNEEMQDSEFTGRISRLVNCLSGYSNKVCIQISENEEISNIISVIMNKRELKTIEMLKKEVNLALTERGYADEKIAEWLEYVE